VGLRLVSKLYDVAHDVASYCGTRSSLCAA